MTPMITSMNPNTLLRLLRRFVKHLNEYSQKSVVVVRVLSTYYSLRYAYYGRLSGDSLYGNATEDDIEVTWFAVKRLLEFVRDNFSKPFMNISNVWGTYLSESINCIVAMATALPPSTSISLEDVAWLKTNSDTVYIPKPVDTSKVNLTSDLLEIVEDLARRSHEQWAADRLKDGWTYAPVRDNAQKHHPMLLPYEKLTEDGKEGNRGGCREQIKVIRSLGWDIERTSTMSVWKRLNAQTEESSGPWQPTPLNLDGVRLSQDVLAISERLAENSHDVWAVGKFKQFEGTTNTHPDLIPYDSMTDAQKEYDRKASTDTLKFLTLCGYNFVKKQARKNRVNDIRFAAYLLKLFNAAFKKTDTNLVFNPDSLNSAERDFIFSVIFPISTKYFANRRDYFLSSMEETCSMQEQEQLLSVLSSSLVLVRKAYNASFGNRSATALLAMTAACDQQKIGSTLSTWLLQFARETLVTPLSSYAQGTTQAVSQVMFFAFKVLVPVLSSYMALSTKAGAMLNANMQRDGLNIFHALWLASASGIRDHVSYASQAFSDFMQTFSHWFPSQYLDKPQQSDIKGQSWPTLSQLLPVFFQSVTQETKLVVYDTLIPLITHYAVKWPASMDAPRITSKVIQTTFAAILQVDADNTPLLVSCCERLMATKSLVISFSELSVVQELNQRLKAFQKDPTKVRGLGQY